MAAVPVRRVRDLDCCVRAWLQTTPKFVHGVALIRQVLKHIESDYFINARIRPRPRLRQVRNDVRWLNDVNAQESIKATVRCAKVQLHAVTPHFASNIFRPSSMFPAACGLPRNVLVKLA